MDRFWNKVKKTDSCWLWQGSICRGYGSFGIRTQEGWRTTSAHRFVWALVYGPVPKNLCVLHLCDVRNCVNPEHLFLGDYADNNADKMEKNRHPCGSQCSRAVLTEHHVLLIRSQLENRKWGDIAKMARKLDVPVTAVKNVLYKPHIWSHIV